MKGERKRRFKFGTDEKRQIPTVKWQKNDAKDPNIVTRSKSVKDRLQNEQFVENNANEINISLDSGDDILSRYQELNDEGGDKDTYRFLHASKTCDLFTEAAQEHYKQNPNCLAKFEFDWDNEIKWGLCWSEAIVCTLCGYKSRVHKLYKEVITTKTGRRAGAPNKALQCALQDERCGNTAIRKILATINTIPPAPQSMQDMASTVGQEISNMTMNDLKILRQKIVEEVGKRDNCEAASIPVEADGQYNTPPLECCGQDPLATRNTGNSNGL